MVLSAVATLWLTAFLVEDGRISFEGERANLTHANAEYGLVSLS